MVNQAFIVAAKRTPFGAFGGKLSTFTASQLGGLASKAALASLPSSTPVDATIFGNVHASDNTAAYLARHVGHHAGLPVTVPLSPSTVSAVVASRALSMRYTRFAW